MDGEIAAVLSNRSIQFADAGVAGGVRGIRAGTGTLMVGASPETYAQIEDLLQRITPTVFHVGGVGAGHTVKLVNNLLNSCNRFAALEAVRLGEANGLSRDAIIEVLTSPRAAVSSLSTRSRSSSMATPGSRRDSRST